ncbi:heme biosynthesis protein HemY [Stappia sp. F7233]|uniref:Heme biosynthesis protein HemY n=1 Tax=Stappia albiluteola TaxID=2758565 RepID=A0A839AHB7_9HYPH|nr:heme biosynthesis HemY N-terminal domain-containing protein [Stappia albiluteola]MBA5778476.1 heme biosynthesis protein HemY [Stappia albiluteola]
MIRVLVFIAVVFAVALGASWVADRPGVITLDWQGYRIETALMTALIAIAALFVAVMIGWGLLRTILRSPDIASRFFRRRRRERGYEALSRGLVSLGLGDAPSARRYATEASRLLKSEPAASLLLAQTAQLAGDRDEARKRFEAMLDDPKLKPVGLHGLFVEAERLGEPVAARHYAEEAASLVPGLPWAGRAVLGYQAMAEDWQAALASLERNYGAKLIDKKTFRRHKAVLMTARALQLEDHEPDQARGLALDAHGLAPDLVPAAVVAARLSSRRGDIRKALKVVETTWKLEPHPDLADAYAHARSGDSAHDRLARIKTLIALRPNSTAGALAFGAVAIEAREWSMAREQLAGVVRSHPTRRACLLMAELEEAEHGDRGRVREWLARAVRAPADETWVADGFISDEWMPVSPVTGRIDAFEWKVPAVLNHEETVEEIDEALMAELPAIAAAEKAPEPEPVKVIEAAPDTAKAEAKPAEPAVPKERREEAPATGAAPEPAAPARETAPGNGSASSAAARPAQSAPAAARPQEKPATPRSSETIDFPLKHMPDDPGPDMDEDEPAQKPGFRFFN